MTVGIAVQGMGWAVLGSDTLFHVHLAGRRAYHVYAEKNQQVGPQCWAMWTGFAARMDRRWSDLPGDPEAVGRMAYGAIDRVLGRRSWVANPLSGPG
jgi:hypothetical protein